MAGLPDVFAYFDCLARKSHSVRHWRFLSNFWSKFTGFILTMCLMSDPLPLYAVFVVLTRELRVLASPSRLMRNKWDSLIRSRYVFNELCTPFLISWKKTAACSLNGLSYFPFFLFSIFVLSMTTTQNTSPCQQVHSSKKDSPNCLIPLEGPECLSWF